MDNHLFSIRKTVKSFGYAFNGLRIVIKEEGNARIHMFAAICVVIAGILFRLSLNEWIAIVFATGFVITAEIVNSAIEKIADFISPDRDERIRKIKDLSAAGVLISAITAVAIGLIIFLPKII